MQERAKLNFERRGRGGCKNTIKVALELCEVTVLNVNPNFHLSSTVKQGWPTGT